jgi:signal transduction histidine kinase
MAELPKSEFIYIIILGSGGMILLIGTIAIFIAVYQKRMLHEQEKQRQKEIEHHRKMVQAQLQSQENERKRIAADLHDSLGSLLYGARLNAVFIGRTASLTTEANDAMHELVDALDQSVHTLKRIAWELTPDAFYQSGLSRSVNSLCTRLNGKGMAVEFHETGNSILWNDDHAMQAFRIVQELINNSIKHAKATLLTVDFAWNGQSLTIAITDNGVGFTLSAQRTGVGWWNIKQRTQQLNAEIHIGQSPIGHGSLVSLTIPLIGV